MNGILRPIRTAARVCFAALAWLLLALVFVQLFHAGSAILVDAGNWAPHRNLGHLFPVPSLLMLALSLIGWMGLRFLLGSLGLFALYILQYVFLHGFSGGAVAALHPVNALVIAGTALWLGLASWRVITEHLTQRSTLALGIAAVALLGGWVALGAGTFPGEGGTGVPSLEAATEADVPERYRSISLPTTDPAAVAKGRQIAEKRCIACHAADFTGKQIGAVRSADLTQSATTRSEQFLLWALSEGSAQGMPAHKALPAEQLQQLVAFIKSLK